jgi:hypothetical protein
MSSERYTHLIADLCANVGVDADYVMQTRTIDVEGFQVRLDYFEHDIDALYLIFQFGVVTAGRTLVVFRLMLEANVLIYAQDQAQLGLDSDTGGIVLFVRLQFETDLSGATLAALLAHYAAHGRYWQQNILQSSDQMFEGIASGEFCWLRA